MKPGQYAHCSYCGARFKGTEWPRTCDSCGRKTWLNPLPVAVMMLPVDNGLLVVRRGIQPGRGELALPGGFMDPDESWQEAACRELREETGIIVDPADVVAHHVGSAPGFLMVFALAPRRTHDSLEKFETNEEVIERVIITQATRLAFPMHTELVARYFETNEVKP